MAVHPESRRAEARTTEKNSRNLDVAKLVCRFIVFRLFKAAAKRKVQINPALQTLIANAQQVDLCRYDLPLLLYYVQEIHLSNVELLGCDAQGLG